MHSPNRMNKRSIDSNDAENHRGGKPIAVKREKNDRVTDVIRDLSISYKVDRHIQEVKLAETAAKEAEEKVRVCRRDRSSDFERLRKRVVDELLSTPLVLFHGAVTFRWSEYSVRDHRCKVTFRIESSDRKYPFFSQEFSANKRPDNSGSIAIRKHLGRDAKDLWDVFMVEAHALLMSEELREFMRKIDT